MQLLVAGQFFAKALQVMSRLVPRRPVQPEIGGIRIKADQDVVTLFATDLQSSMQFALPAQTHRTGEATVMARVMSDIVGTIKDEDILLSLSDSGESLRITSGPAAFRLPTLAGIDAPVPISRTHYQCTARVEDVVDLIQRTSFCAVESEDPSPFTGMFISHGDGFITMAASDNYQLAYYSREAEGGSGGGQEGKSEAVLPTGALLLVARAFHLIGGEYVRLAWSERDVQLFNDRVWCSVRRLDVAYPDLSRFTGDIAGIQFETEKGPLIETVRQVASVDEHKNPRLCMTIDGDRLQLSSEAGETGEAHAFLLVKGDHPQGTVWLDAKRVLAAVKAQPTEAIVLNISEPLAPVAIWPADTNVRFRAILTPLRYSRTQPAETA